MPERAQAAVRKAAVAPCSVPFTCAQLHSACSVITLMAEFCEGGIASESAAFKRVSTDRIFSRATDVATLFKAVP